MSRNTNNRYNNHRQQNRRQEAGRAYAVTSSENGRNQTEKKLEDIPVVKEFPDDFQDSLDDEEDTRNDSSGVLNDLERNLLARALFYSNLKDSQKRDCWSKTSVPSYQSPFQSKLLLSSENKPEPRQIKDFEAKYHKIKAKLTLLSSSALAPSSSSGKDTRTLSSPDHPTTNLEDVFFSNFLNYVPQASPDYIPTSPGKTYSSASNLFGIALPTLSLFTDDPYMKALQAFYTENSPILPPNIIPPKTQEFFLPEGLLSPMQLSPSTPSQPQALEIGETSRKSTIKRHEEETQGIQCYLEEIPPERFEHIENGIEGLDKGTIIIQRDFEALATELQQAHTQISKLQRKQIGSNHKISLARYRIAELAEVINDMETRHQEDIEKLMNSIIELQNRIQMPPKRASTSESPAMTQDAIQKVSSMTVYQTTTKESLTTEELSTTIPAATIVTPTIVTTIVDNRIEGKKLVEPMLLLHQKTVGMPEISLCVKGAITITPDPVLFMEKKADGERDSKYIPVSKKFQMSFPKYQPGIPPVRQELSKSTQDTHLPRLNSTKLHCLWELHPVLFVKKKDGSIRMSIQTKLPKELNSIHNTFHVSNLKKCLSDESIVIPIKELQLDDKLNFVEEPVEVMDREIKQLKRSRIPIIKVRWNSKRGPEFTWEREDEIHAKYPHLFSTITSSSIKSRDEISVRGGDYNNPQFS
ncbi:hypothetical protein Tco_0952260 [Tanacetum coccineum]|uniref:Reverse transcriptase domain-containing protein n=1 Tax=Tanacetum coccineum TaxID=301880 RepID=A0ABQ5DWK4_9ASTR